MSRLEIILLRTFQPEDGLSTAQIFHSENELIQDYNTCIMTERILELRGGTDLTMNSRI